MLDRTSPSEEALRLAKTSGLIRVRDAEERGIHREVLRRLTKQGRLTRVSRGTYAPANAEASTHHDLAIAATRVPRGVVCLLSALAYHEIGSQLPHEVWMTIDRRERKPRLGYPRMRFVLSSGDALRTGIETVKIDGVGVPISSPTKCVVDCFRFRRTVGLDVAIEALRETLRQRRATPSEIMECAQRCRVGTVIRPYLEAMS